MADAFDAASFERWRSDPVGFIEHCMINPETDQPFVLLDAEKQFLKHAFTLDDSGRLLYPELIYACPKKSGKTTFAAILTVTLVMLFGGRYAEAICCANDYEQSVGRVHAAIRRIIEASAMLRAMAKVTADRVTLADATILAIPSGFASAAGSNQNIAVFDELWAFASERARRLFDELVPVPSKKIACRLTVTYAGFENESTLLLELYRRGLAQPEIAPSLHAGDGVLMFWSHDVIAPWQTSAWLTEMRRSLRPAQYARMIENQFTVTESAFIDMNLWDACTDKNLGHMVTQTNLPVFIGVDASTKRDSTALVCCCWDDANHAFDERGVLKDGRAVRVPTAMRDSMRTDIARHPAVLDAPMFDAASRRPGFRFTTDTAANDAVDAAYTSYEREMSQAWRTSDASGQPEGAICTVREGGGRYGPEGAPGRMRRVDGVLACVADDRRDDSRRDSPTTMDAEYAAYDARMTQAWRTPS